MQEYTYSKKTTAAAAVQPQHQRQQSARSRNLKSMLAQQQAELESLHIHTCNSNAYLRNSSPNSSRREGSGGRTTHGDHAATATTTHSYSSSRSTGAPSSARSTTGTSGLPSLWSEAQRGGGGNSVRPSTAFPTPSAPRGFATDEQHQQQQQQQQQQQPLNFARGQLAHRAMSAQRARVHPAGASWTSGTSLFDHTNSDSSSAGAFPQPPKHQQRQQSPFHNSGSGSSRNFESGIAGVDDPIANNALATSPPSSTNNKVFYEITPSEYVVPNSLRNEADEPSAFTVLLKTACDVLHSYQRLRIGLTEEEVQALVQFSELVSIPTYTRDPRPARMLASAGMGPGAGATAAAAASAASSSAASPIGVGTVDNSSMTSQHNNGAFLLVPATAPPSKLRDQMTSSSSLVGLGQLDQQQLPMQPGGLNSALGSGHQYPLQYTAADAATTIPIDVIVQVLKIDFSAKDALERLCAVAKTVLPCVTARFWKTRGEDQIVAAVPSGTPPPLGGSKEEQHRASHVQLLNKSSPTAAAAAASPISKRTPIFSECVYNKKKVSKNNTLLTPIISPSSSSSGSSSSSSSSKSSNAAKCLGVFELTTAEGYSYVTSTPNVAVPLAYKRANTPPNFDAILEFITRTASHCINFNDELDDIIQHKTSAEMMLEMVNELASNELDEFDLARSIMNNALKLCEADRCTIFLLNKEGNLDAIVEDKKISVKSNVGIAGRVVITGETFNVPDAYQNEFFDDGVDKITGYQTHSVLCMPVYTDDKIVAVTELINKKPLTLDNGQVLLQRAFTKEDEIHFRTFSTFVGLALHNCRKNQALELEKKRTDMLFKAIAIVSRTEIGASMALRENVEIGAKTLIPHIQYAYLYTLDKERQELHLSGHPPIDNNDNIRGVGEGSSDSIKDFDANASASTHSIPGSSNKKITGDIAFHVKEGVAGLTASTGKPHNIPNPPQCPNYVHDCDAPDLAGTAFSLLSVPVMHDDQLLGVLQVVNKQDEFSRFAEFTEQDATLLSHFSLFIGVWIHNMGLFEFAVKAGRAATKLSSAMQARRKNITKSLIYSKQTMEALKIELSKQTSADIQTAEFDMFEIRKVPYPPPLDVAVRVATNLIMSTGIPAKIKCSEYTLASFIVAMREHYRHVPYHNFYHAVDVLQTVYTFLYKGRAKEFLTPLEIFILFIVCLAHDVDHMGLNNSFHLKSDSPLGILSSVTGNQSVLEIHHCNITIDMLSNSELNVFSGLDEADEAFAYRCMIDCVLATDMSKHMAIMKEINELDGPPDKNKADHRKLVMMALIKTADISNVTKPFHISRQWGISVMEEFCVQGDEEKSRGMDVLPMFDREKNNDLAKSQIGFINGCAEKWYTAVVNRLFPGMQWTVDRLLENKEKWESGTY